MQGSPGKDGEQGPMVSLMADTTLAMPAPWEIPFDHWHPLACREKRA